MTETPVYENELSIREALQKYFDFYGFVNGGYDDKWFKIKFAGPIALKLPNVKSRVDAVKLHDIHHLVTDYPANLKGEALIGAWEIASGCGKFYAAWLLNFASLMYGSFIWPVALYKAFMRGLDSNNLYHGIAYDDKLLKRSIGEIRSALLNKHQNPKGKKLFTYLMWTGSAILATVLCIAVPLMLIKWIFF